MVYKKWAGYGRLLRTHVVNFPAKAAECRTRNKEQRNEEVKKLQFSI